jgi:hypothetical protein
MVLNWMTPAHQAILDKHKESYNNSHGKKQNDLLQNIKKDLKEVKVEQIQGTLFPKSLRKVNQIYINNSRTLTEGEENPGHPSILC